MVHQNNTNTVTHSSSFSSSLTMAASSLFRVIQRGSTVIKSSYAATSVLVSPRLVGRGQLYSICSPFEKQSFWLGLRELSYGKVNLVIRDGKTKFETHEVEPPRKDKWKTKKRLKMQRKREKEKRKAANRRDPRRLGVKGKKKKQKFASPEERIKFKIDNARVKEALLIERLKRYEVAKAHGPDVKPDGLTGEERFYLKKMAQKSSNYLQVGRRGLFGGVILNMHMHWKKHETVKCICKPCKPGQVHEYAQELARLSGGIPIHIIGDDTIIFYRGKNYIQPEVMSPVDTLSKKKALEKSKYEQSLESVRRFIAIAEKELELYHRHVALYGDPSNRNPLSILDGPSGSSNEKRNHDGKNLDSSNYYLSETEADSSQTELSESEDNFENGNLSMGESDSEEEEDGMLGSDDDDEEREVHFTKMNGQSVVCSTTGSSSISKHTHHLKSCIE